jgi:membrane-bound inhibitor of C-type lysozyme
MSAHSLVAFGLVVTLALSGCKKPEAPGEPATPVTASAAPTGPVIPAIGYACESGQTVSLQYPDTATAQLTYKGQLYPLRLVPSGSGARYAGSGLEWWIATRDGQESATLSRLGPNDDVGVAVLERCGRPSANPALPLPGPSQQIQLAPGGILPAATPCKASDLRLGAAGGDAGAGNRVGIISVLNTGSAACGLSGYPALSLLGEQGRPVTNLRIDQNPNTATPVSIPPNGRAYFDVAWSVVPDEGAGQTLCPSVAQIAVRIAGSQAPLTLAMVFQPCGARIRVNPYRSSADPADAPAPIPASATT